MNNKNNVFWLVGDRFLCINRKNKLIKNYTSGNEKWSINNIVSDNATKFCSLISQKNLFGPTNILYVHEGSVPEIKKIIGFIEKLPNNKGLIVLDGNSDKIRNTRLNKKSIDYKLLKKYLEYYEPVLKENGYPDKNIIPKTLKYIKSISKCNISDSVIEEIFRYCGYDIGVTVHEIENICLYKKSNKILKEDIKTLKASKENLKISDILDALSKRNTHCSLKLFSEISNELDIKSYFFLYFTSIIEHFTMFQYCKIAIESGITGSSSIASSVSCMWVNNGKNVDENIIRWKYEKNKENLENISFEEILWIIEKARYATEKFVEGKFTIDYIISEFVKEACIREV